MSLMRSCSAWPSGIWIDGDRRTAPDGSSFAWQHWSHTFEYALAAGPGDWRTAGFNLLAEDYNHDLIAVTAGPAAGAGQPPAAGLSVEPATVTVSALKPRGNPLAAGRTRALADAATQNAAVTLRLRETSGRPTTARVRLGQGEVSAAWLTDLLEESDGAPLPVENGTIFVDMPAFGTATLLIRGDSASRGATPIPPRAPWGDPSPGPPLEGPIPQTPLGGDPAPQTRLHLRRPWHLRPLASSLAGCSLCMRGTGCTGRGRLRPGTCRWRCTSPPSGSRWPNRARWRCWRSPWAAGPNRPPGRWNWSCPRR